MFPLMFWKVSHIASKLNVYFSYLCLDKNAFCLTKSVLLACIYEKGLTKANIAK